MDSGDRSVPVGNKDVGRATRRMIAWLAEEFETSEDEAVAIMCEAAREVRGLQSDREDFARTLAGVLIDAATHFQVMRELWPGGIPLREFREVVSVIQQLRSLGLDVGDLNAIKNQIARFEACGLSIDHAEALLVELKRVESQLGPGGPSTLRSVAGWILKAESLDRWLIKAREERRALEEENEILRQESARLEYSLLEAKRDLDAERQTLVRLQERHQSLSAATDSMKRFLRTWYGLAPRPKGWMYP